MPDIDPDFMCHHLTMDPKVRPIRQRRRKFNEERRLVVQEETRKLLNVEHIREIQYPEWLANVVLVKKANGKWRMCVDFTDLNKACPKDSYPLPSIDALVDSASRCKMLSFLDAFSGYNQIKMHPRDESKTKFMTETCCYCYKVMPFGLKRNSRFVLTEECEIAFLKLKEYLVTPPVLCKPQTSVPLRLYFAVTEWAISSVLVQEQDQVQKPISFVSKAFQGPETRYQSLEKAALAVVFSARRLRHYFHSFTVVVMTDLPIQKVLQKPDVAGRMVRWAVELSEFDIVYEPRGSIKGQIYADFVAELSPGGAPQEVELDSQWLLSMDGSSNQQGSGTVIVLEGPYGPTGY